MGYSCFIQAVGRGEDEEKALEEFQTIFTGGG